MPVLQSRGRTTGPSAADLSLFQLLEPEVLANPYPLYRRVREYEPVHWDPYVHSWVVTTYPEVMTVLMKFQADRIPALAELDRLGLSAMAPFSAMMAKQMLFMDGPAHARLRGICSVAFTPRRIELLRESVDEIANGLIDAVYSKGEMDVVADFAGPFPAMVTAKLLGVPVEDHVNLKRWCTDFAELFGNFQGNPDRVPEVLASLESLQGYVQQKLADAKNNPNDSLITSLLASELNGARLNEEELVANIIVLMIGGFETTTNLISNGLLTLLRHPEQLTQLRNDPSLAASAVEELLRYESPTQYTSRIAQEDTVLGGKAIKKGSTVTALLAAANRDPNRFPDPDRLDLLRQDNRHVAFGWAAHFCFGAPLTRLEAQVAFNVLLRRLKDLSLAETTCTWRGNTGLRGLASLKVRFEPAF